MRKTIVLFMLLCTACQSSKPQKFQAEFDGLFDTHTEIIGYAQNQSVFSDYAGRIYDELKTYSQLFDIYNSYDGLTNLKTINDNAGLAPLEVDEKIINYLLQSKLYYAQTDQTVNIAMGSVLSIWHAYREAGIADPANAAAPAPELLREAAQTINLDDLIIDEKNKTVFLRSKGMSLDAGGTAKGYAARLAVQAAVEMGMESALVNIGGNIIAVGKPLDGVRSRWGVGIQDPKLSVDGASNILDTVFVNNVSVVSSGDYQRYYVADGVVYHHIIDPKTYMPVRRYAAVSVIHSDSGLADALSTALFILTREHGEELLQRYGAEAIWVEPDGNVYYTDGYKAISKNFGNYSAVDPTE